MSDNTVHTPKTFSLEIEKDYLIKDVHILITISIYCEQMGIEPVTVDKTNNKKFKRKNRDKSFRDLNYLPKSN